MPQIYFRLLFWMAAGLLPAAVSAQNAPEAAAHGQVLNYDSRTPYARLTLWPDFEGGRVAMDFSRWQPNCPDDFLYLYDGPTTDSPLLIVLGCEAPPTTAASPWNATGALTLVWVAGGLLPQGHGWSATARTECRAELQRKQLLPAVFGQPDSIRLRHAAAGALTWESSTDGQHFRPRPEWGSSPQIAVPKVDSSASASNARRGRPPFRPLCKPATTAPPSAKPNKPTPTAAPTAPTSWKPTAN